MLQKFAYAAPATRKELLELFAERRGKAKLLAGGTDLLVNIRNGIMNPELVINVKRVQDYSGLTWSAAEGLVLKPSTTINEVLRDANVRKLYPLLCESAHDLASYQVRNRATVIGNVVNASPCSDMAPALLCLGAKAVIVSSRGEREVPFREFFKGVKKTVVQEDEILERIVVPAASSGARGLYRKLKRINGHDLGIVGVAFMKKDGAVRLGISSSAPTPVLVDGLSESDSVEDVVSAAKKAISPISDVRCSKEYRQYMVEVFVRRLFAEVK